MKSIITLTTCIFFFTQLGIGQLSAPIESEETAIIEFVETEANFGKIEEGEKASHVYVFKNNGNVPLLIISAKGSCGCTVPYFPKDPIMPGETSEIEVEFNSKNKSGRRNQKVVVTANTDPKQTFLYLKGEIMIKETASIEEAKLEDEKHMKVKEELESISPSCLSLFPNPANDFVQLELKDHIGKTATVTIFNQMGQEIKSQKIDRISRESTRIDVNGFIPGAYMISIMVDNLKPLTQCFMIARP